MRLIIWALIGLLWGILPIAVVRAEAPQRANANDVPNPVIDSSSTVTIASEANLAIYFPLVSNSYPIEWPALSPSPDASSDFIIERNETVTRLIRLTENGGHRGRGIDCGRPGAVEVFAFGPEGEANRLGDVAVQVVHTDAKGNQRREVRYTRVDGPKRGTVRFPLEAYAEVKLVEDASGRPITSESITVTGDPLHVNSQWLSNGGYCTDTQSCWALRHQKTCQGKLSWNVVFKQR